MPKPKPHNITCPYCYEVFSHEKVHFRASSNRHYEGNDVSEQPVKDVRLSEYRSQYNLDQALTAPVIAPDNNTTEQGYIPCRHKKYDSNKLLESVTDQFGGVSKERICPACHNTLPKSAGKAKGAIIAFLGDTSVGKTVYMTTLIDKLQNEVSIGFDADCISVNEVTHLQYLEKYYNPMYRDGILPTSTRANELNYPLIYEFNIGRRYTKNGDWEPERTAILAFYDIAGEGMRDKRYLNTFGKHLSHSDAYIFLIDPLQTAIAERVRSLSGISAPRDKRDSAAGIIFAVKASESIDFSKYTAIALTKSDLLRGLPSGYVHEHSNIFRKTSYTKYLDTTEIESVNDEVKQLLEKADPKFLHYVDRTFRHFKLFAVSSLGGPVEGGGVNRIRGGHPDPIRVEEPFLWILNKLGYIPDGPTEKRRFSLFSRR